MITKKIKSFKVAFGGIVTGVSIVIMFLTGVIPTLTYALPAIAGALLIAVSIEIGPKFAGVVYFAVSVLSLLVVADKEAAVMYAAFFGYYPIVKGIIEKKTNGTVSWIIKYIIFNISVISAFFIVSKVFMISYEEVEFLGKYSLPVLLLIGNIVFAFYDIALTRILSVYIYNWRKHIKRMFK